MVLSEGISSRVTSSSVTSSRGSTSREFELLIIESGSLTIQRVLHVSVHGVSWWLVSVPRPSQGRRLHRDTFIESTFTLWVKPAVRAVGGLDGVRSSRLHEASCSGHFQTCGPILRLATLPHKTPAVTCHTPKPLWIFFHQPIETRERKIGQPDMVAGNFLQPHRVRRLRLRLFGTGRRRSDVAVAPLGDEIRRLISWYERALHQARRAGNEPAPARAADPIEAPREWTTPRPPELEQAQPRTQPRYPERRAASWSETPMYPHWERSQANECDTRGSSGWHWRGDERRAYSGWDHDAPRSSAAYQRYLSAAEDRHVESRSLWEPRRRHADDYSSWEPRHDAREDGAGRRMSALAPRADPQTPPRALARQEPRIGPEQTPPRAAVANEAPGNLGRLGLLTSEVDEAKDRALDAEYEAERFRDELAHQEQRLLRIEQSHDACKRQFVAMRKTVGWDPEQTSPKRERTASRFEPRSAQDKTDEQEEKAPAPSQSDAATPRSGSTPGGTA
jgi:hypothetical protein